MDSAWVSAGHGNSEEGSSRLARVKSEDSPTRELTLRVFVLGALLSAVLASANAYLGLFAGMTVSASIPAAVISMAMLRALRGTILENNLVQTAASAGESAAAGAIFTLPALILLGAWARFDFATSAALIAIGGVLGVLFTIFLRRAMTSNTDLPFPEGVATAEVLRAGHSQGGELAAQARSGLVALSIGAAFGAFCKLLESGFAWSRSVVEGAVTTPLGTFYGGMGLSPALAAVGHIVGFRVALLIFAGGFINWVLVVPQVVDADASGTALELAWSAWSTKTRYLGVGAMCVGGLGALFDVRSSIATAFRATIAALSPSSSGAGGVARTERDLPAKWVMGSIAFSLLPIFLIFQQLLGSALLSVCLAVVVLVFGFLFSSVAAYMAGLVGSSHNPVSGVTIATILFASLLLSFLGVEALGVNGAAGPAAAILVGSIVCTAAAIGGDNMQDLKAGVLLRATPARQQVMQLVGVLAAAAVLGPVLQILLDGYGLGAPTAEHPHALRAPQATLMASVAKGVFGGGLPWGYFFSGAGLGAGVIVADLILKARGSEFRVPVLAVALGLYLPWELSIPVLLGGLTKGALDGSPAGAQRGVLAAAGLITGEALVGILLATGVAVTSEPEWISFGPQFNSGVLGVILFLGALGFLRSRVAKTSDAGDMG